MDHYKRIVSAVVLLPPVVFFLLYASRGLFLLLVCVVISLSLYEYFCLLPLKRLAACVVASYAFALGLALVAYVWGVRGMPLALSLGLILLSVCALWQAESASSPFLALAHCLFGVFLIGWGLSHVVLLRSLEAGKEFVFLLCVVVWVGDVVALYIGRGLGRHLMVPAVSPGKTWEGAVAGGLSCLVAATVGTRMLGLPLSLYQSLVFGLLIAFTAQVSDLAESLLKRYTGVKDSGTFMPGHGGLLDRLDSFFLAAPLAFYLLGFLTSASFV